MRCAEDNTSKLLLSAFAKYETDAEILNILERLDGYAGRYDNAREVIREGK